MRQRGIAALALPFPSSEREAIVAATRGERHGDGRHPGACLALTGCRSTALENVAQELRLLLGSICEKAWGGIAVVGSDDDATAGRQSLDESPEFVRQQSLRGFLAERLKTLACDGQVVHAAVRPVMPENPIGLCTDHAGAIGPGEIGAFGPCAREAMPVAGGIVRQA